MTENTQTTAVCGAYMMVAYADANFERVEEARFLSTVLNDDALSFLDSGAVSGCYNRLAQDFEKDYRQAASVVCDAISACRDDGPTAAAVKLSARRAIVADQKIMPQEEAALDQIAEALGLEKGAV